MNGCQTLADLLRRAASDGATEDLLDGARCCLLDFVTCTILGAREKIGESITSYVAASDRADESTIVGAAAGFSAEGAALANGTLAHALDFDDVSLAMSGHPSAPVFAAALALAEHQRLSGKRVLLAAILGIETECKLGRIMNPALSRTGWHPTRVLGSLGSTASCGVLLNLNREQFAHALGIACSLACGVKANFGSMTKPLHVGIAARNGITAARLAAVGWTAGPDALDGRFGLMDNLIGTSELDGLAETFAKPYEIISPGITFKQYPSCAGTHPAIDAMANLVAEHDLHPRQIQNIRCSVTPFVRGVAIADRPTTGLEGKFSVPFCMAAYLLERSVSPEHFNDEFVSSKAVRELIAKTEMVESSDLSPDGFSGCGALLEITLTDGRTLSARRGENSPEPDESMSQEELVGKYRRCVQPLIAAPLTEDILKAVTAFAHAEQINDMMALLKLANRG